MMKNDGKGEACYVCNFSLGKHVGSVVACFCNSLPAQIIPSENSLGYTFNNGKIQGGLFM